MKKLKVIGVNFGHDSSAALIVNGKIVMAIEEEKMSRIKQDIGWPKKAIARILYENNLEKSEIDIIAFEDNISKQLGYYEILYRFTKNRFYKYLEYCSRIINFIFRFYNRIDNKKNSDLIFKFLKKDGFNSKIEFYDHHKSHAATAFYTAPFKSDLIITSDGRGGIYSFNFYLPTKNGIELLHGNKYDSSVGVFYSTITEILGFRANRHEGKITGLAAYGNETRLVDDFFGLFMSDNNGLKRYPFTRDNRKNQNFTQINNLDIINKINLYNSSSSISRHYGFVNLLLKQKILKIVEGYKKEDIAYACQKVAEKITINEFLRVCNKNNLHNLNISLAGGVFANVRMNQLLYELDNVKNIFIHPAMGDSGLALGNAILADIYRNEKNQSYNSYSISNSFLGANYSNELSHFIENYKNDKILVEKMVMPAKRIAKLLNENKIVGLWNGRMEWGPRALGSRSIILNTFNKEVNKTLNDRLNRTEFMPFAPVVLDFYAEKYFPAYKVEVPAAKYMTITYDTNEKYKDLLQATVHVDGTARPQVIKKIDSSLYYEILEEFEKLSGCGALVNTSFNAHEEPILSSPDTAINALINNRVDYLVMEEYIFTNKK